MKPRVYKALVCPACGFQFWAHDLEEGELMEDCGCLIPNKLIDVISKEDHEMALERNKDFLEAALGFRPMFIEDLGL